MSRPFKSELVIEEKISEATLKAYHVGFDENKFRLKPLVDVLMRTIPEFTFGCHEGECIQLTDAWDKLREAARLVYTTDKYQRRGEFGEIILHLLLRDFCGTIPLISKIYFKDARNSTVKGFDGIHVEINGDSKKLWLGESKLYTEGKRGVIDLANDIKNHLEKDFLMSEFNLISKKIPTNIPERDYWITLMHKHYPLTELFTSVVVPCVCTYSSDLFENHKEATKSYLKDFRTECNGLKKVFDKTNVVTNFEVILLLLPIPCKDELVTELDERLKRAQQI